jgi:hypothetical protein
MPEPFADRANSFRWEERDVVIWAEYSRQLNNWYDQSRDNIPRESLLT